MTRYEAIDILKDLLEWYMDEEGDVSETTHVVKAVHMAINELKISEANKDELESQRQKAKADISNIAYEIKLSAITISDLIDKI